MNVARILYPIKVLGPGNRLGIWLVGCHRKCEGCSNPELWEQKEYYEIVLDDLISMLQPILEKEELDGIVITGGEPFNQAKELLQLLKHIEKYTEDILVYTGYLKEELQCKDVSSIECLNHIGVLVDGPYIEMLNNNITMRGSSNQNVYVLRESLKQRYETYLAETTNEIQNFMTRNGMVSVGIHKKDFKNLLVKKSLEKGVMIDE